MTITSSSRIPVLPLRDIVVFPHMIVPLFVGREKSVRALEEVMGSSKQILLLTQTDAATEDPETGDMFAVGTIGNILQLLKLPDGTVKVLVEGISRAKVDDITAPEGYMIADVREYIEDDETDTRNSCAWQSDNSAVRTLHQAEQENSLRGYGFCEPARRYLQNCRYDCLSSGGKNC